MLRIFFALGLVLTLQPRMVMISHRLQQRCDQRTSWSTKLLRISSYVKKYQLQETIPHLYFSSFIAFLCFIFPLFPFIFSLLLYLTSFPDILYCSLLLSFFLSIFVPFLSVMIFFLSFGSLLLNIYFLLILSMFFFYILCLWFFFIPVLLSSTPLFSCFFSYFPFYFSTSFPFTVHIRRLIIKHDSLDNTVLPCMLEKFFYP